MTSEERDELRRREEERMAQCGARSHGGCILVSTELGWQQMMMLGTCDACFRVGGSFTPEGDKVRDDFRDGVLKELKKPEKLKKLGREVLVPLLRYHLTEEERGEAEKAGVDFEQAVFRRERWQDVKLTWENAKSFTMSLFSAAGGTVDEEVLQKRRKSCFGDEGTPPCSELRRTSKGAFCGSCGCGENGLAELDDKLKYPYLKCPMKKEGFSNASDRI